jgi:AcrR family transcriptional regulator
MTVMGIAERKHRQKQALRARILDAARRIVMREGFTALSMRKIADAIEYSPATLYLHFASRDEIAHALCEEGFAQLLKMLEPLAAIVDPVERLKAFGRAYVAFGVAHPQTYRLIFMEDPSYTGAAFGGAAKARVLAGDVSRVGAEGVSPSSEPVAAFEDNAQGQAAPTPLAEGEDAGATALHIMIAALEELKATGRLPASTDAAVWAEAFWATMHGIVALNLTCPVFPASPLETVVDVALDAWLGASRKAPQSSLQTAGRSSA